MVLKGSEMSDNPFLGFETWQGFVVLDLGAVIKWAAAAVSRKTKPRGPRSREAPRPQLDLAFLEAALAADWIKASISLHVCTLQYRKHPSS